MTQKGQVNVILLDFAKAFDKMIHHRLLHKLNYYGFQESTLHWIQPFLSHRKQPVLLDGSKSTEADVLSGVPQGTIIGSLLFLAFINDLPESTKHSDAILLADDSLLYRHVTSNQGQYDQEIHNHKLQTNPWNQAHLQVDLSALEGREKPGK